MTNVPDLKWHIAIINWLLPGPRLDIHNIIFEHFTTFPSKPDSSSFTTNISILWWVRWCYLLCCLYFSQFQRIQYLNSKNNVIYHGNWKLYCFNIYDYFEVFIQRYKETFRNRFKERFSWKILSEVPSTASFDMTGSFSSFLLFDN